MKSGYTMALRRSQNVRVVTSARGNGYSNRETCYGYNYLRWKPPSLWDDFLPFLVVSPGHNSDTDKKITNGGNSSLLCPKRVVNVLQVNGRKFERRPCKNSRTSSYGCHGEQQPNRSYAGLAVSKEELG